MASPPESLFWVVPVPSHRLTESYYIWMAAITAVTGNFQGSTRPTELTLRARFAEPLLDYAL